ncbi:hypothetical protein [Maribacter sp. R86514]|uniref:hypothetical protein n=1 Tax=Maribacter sp. R86514 TaxID=3093854 RepID=UPI0037CAEE65
MQSISKILFLLFFTISFVSNAQKVKVKKDLIIIDNIEVGLIQAVDKKEIIYVVKDLSGTEIMTVDVDIAKGSTRPFEYNWMTIKSKNYPQVNVVDYSMISMSLSHAKIIAEILTKTYDIFSAEGLNTQNVEAFFAEERTSKYKADATGNGGVDMKGLNEGFAGKVKLKKNQIIFDGEPVVSVSENQGVYTYTDLKSDEVLRVSYNALTIPEVYSKKWLVVKDSENRESELQMDYMSAWGGLNLKKDLARLLSEKYNIITKEGIKNLETFYAVDREKLSEGYLEEYNKLQSEINKREAENKARRADFVTNETGSVLLTNGNGDVGRFFLNGKNIQNVGGTRNLMVLGDVEDKVIAKFEGIDAGNYTVTTFDKQVYNFNSKVFSPNNNKDKFFNEALDFIIEIGYADQLEYSLRGYLEKRLKAAKEAYNVEKENSVNIYSKNGYAIDEDGVRLEGKVTILFEELIDPTKATGGNILTIDGGDSKFGKEAKVEYLNAKDKVRYKTFKSKSEEQVFVLNEDGNYTKYLGIKVSPDAITALENTSSISFNYSGFYEVLEENELAVIFRDPLEGGLGIKLASEDKGYLFQNSIKTKNTQKLEKYFSACTDMPKELLNSEFNEISDVKSILEYYKDSCK